MKNISIIILCLSMLGFMSACKNSKGPKAEVGEAAKVEQKSGQTLTVNTDASKIMWEGYKPGTTHTGTIDIQSGNVLVSNGKVVGGSFVIDMSSIVVTDLEGDMKANLENHLKGTTEGKENDFFNVAEFPTAEFVITKTTALQNDPEGNVLVYGNLTMKGIEKEISGFKAQVNIQEDGSLTVQAPLFTIDRTQWKIEFMSKSILGELAERFVNDEIGLKIRLMANP